jgi:hypothetical protein
MRRTSAYRKTLPPLGRLQVHETKIERGTIKNQKAPRTPVDSPFQSSALGGRIPSRYASVLRHRCPLSLFKQNIGEIRPDTHTSLTYRFSNCISKTTRFFQSLKMQTDIYCIYRYAIIFGGVTQSYYKILRQSLFIHCLCFFTKNTHNLHIYF